MKFSRANFDKQIDKLPKDVLWCKNCTISNQRPRIVFDDNQICSACKNLEYKKNYIDWDLREKELIDTLDQYRKKDGSWDVLVPSSGGKDSGYVAHILKHKYNMNPLLVTWSPLQYTKIGLKNYDSLNYSGFTCIKASQNGYLNRKLSRLCLEEFGDAFHTFVLGQIYFPLHMAINFNIKLIFYGENGEVEYAGDPKAVDRPFTDVLEHQDWLEGYLKGTTLKNLLNYASENKDYIDNDLLKSPDLKFYSAPKKEIIQRNECSKLFYFSYFQEWNPQENFYYCSDYTGFEPNPERTEGTFSKYSSLDDKFDGMHYYMRYIKFGLGRCCEDTAHEIRDGNISRDEGISLMQQYEGEFPSKYFNEFLNYLDISEEFFWEIADSWRLDHLWEKNSNNWYLKHPIK